METVAEEHRKWQMIEALASPWHLSYILLGVLMSIEPEPQYEFLFSSVKVTSMAYHCS